MQNKGFVKVFAILLTLVCAFYLSFSLVTRHYEGKAAALSNGDLNEGSAGNRYLDSLATQKVWLGYTLKECRERELGLGLDLKGGMNVILEVDASAVIRSLGNTDDVQFNQALSQASAENKKGSNKDYITLFVEKYEAINPKAKLVDIFGNNAQMKDQIKPNASNAEVEAALRLQLKSVAKNTFDVLRTRIDRFGVVAPNIQQLDRTERILVELPGIREPERVRKLLQGNANLEFWRTYDARDNVLISAVSEINQKSAAALTAIESETTKKVAAPDSTKTKKEKAGVKSLKSDSTALASTNTASDSTATSSAPAELGFTKPLSAYFLPQTQGNCILGLVNKTDTAAVNRILARYKDLYPSEMKFAWDFKAFDPTQRNAENPKATPLKPDTYFSLYVLKGVGSKKGPSLTGESVVSAKADQSDKGWGVSMAMNSNGAKQWSAITAAEVHKCVAIVLDGYVYSAPSITERIDGGNSSITGSFTPNEAKDLENVLKSGKLKAGIRIVQEDVVGPSLGHEAIVAGLTSFVIALVALMAYMCLIYGIIPGMIANCAMLINIFFTIGILASFSAVMTLPGIAGMVLTLAMAVDANVLIYERTKEELRIGKNVKTALMDGYKHAFSAIIDGHLSSIITGIILAYFGTGPIRGFATTLIIGVLMSLFTSVFMTRLFYDYYLNKGKFSKLTFETGISRNLFRNPKIKWLEMRKKAAIGSLTIILLGVISMFTLGLNRGIDFTGGRNYIVRFDHSVDTGKMQAALAPEFTKGGDSNSMVQVITIGSSDQVRITTNYKIKESGDAVETEIRSKLQDALIKANFIKPSDNIANHIKSSQVVGPSIADDLRSAAIIAVIVSMFCMALYILIRFRDLAFSIGTFVAVAHDALIVIFVYSFFHRVMPFSMEIDQTFIAAILTVIGYSINDTVVIFDRIRELRTSHPKADLHDTINESLNTTLARTVNTSFCAILVVFCIFILGGDTIRSFTFAMLFGIIVGTYSSVFVATPIAFEIIKKRQAKLLGK